MNWSNHLLPRTQDGHSPLTYPMFSHPTSTEGIGCASGVQSGNSAINWLGFMGMVLLVSTRLIWKETGMSSTKRKVFGIGLSMEDGYIRIGNHLPEPGPCYLIPPIRIGELYHAMKDVRDDVDKVTPEWVVMKCLGETHSRETFDHQTKIIVSSLRDAGFIKD